MKAEKYTASERLRPDKLATSPSARLERVRRALNAAGLRFNWPNSGPIPNHRPDSPTLGAVRGLGQASASEVQIGSVLCCVSYEEIVAYRLSDGSEVATPRNYYSRTTDRTLDSWLRRSDVVRMQPADLHAALVRRFATQ